MPAGAPRRRPTTRSPTSRRRGLAHEAAIRAQARRAGGATPGSRRLSRRAGGAARGLGRPGRAPDPGPRGRSRRVNEILRQAPRVELVPGDGGIGVGHRHTQDDPTGEALARVVEPLVEAIAAGETGPLPDLRQRRLPLGVRGHVARRPAPLVRHDLVRQPREGASLPLEAAAARRRGDGGGRTGRPAALDLLEQRPDLGREPGHRLLVVVRGDAGDQVAVAELDVAARASPRRPRACPTGWSSQCRATRLRSNAAWNSRSASARSSRMKTVPIPVVRSISAGSRPTVSQCCEEDLLLAPHVLDRRRRRCSCRRTSRPA